MIAITSNAARKIKALAQKKGLAGGFLRVKVVSGGCSGLSYSFEVTEESLPGDLVAEKDGAKAAVDPASDLFVSGSTLDYADGLMKSGFEITNPKAVSTCSCGTSFSTEEAAPKEESFNV